MTSLRRAHIAWLIKLCAPFISQVTVTPRPSGLTVKFVSATDANGLMNSSLIRTTETAGFPE